MKLLPDKGQRAVPILTILGMVCALIAIVWANNNASCGDAAGIGCRVQRAEQADCNIPTPVYDSVAGIRNENAVELALSNCGY